MATRRTSKKPVEKTDPLWIKGTQSGFDQKSGKYRSFNGPFVKREKALEETSLEDVYGAIVKGNFTPLSDAAEKLENAIAGFDIKRADKDWFQNTQQTIRAIPASILARMKIAEHYASTEGDVFQCLTIPIDVGLRFEPENDVQCSDKGAQRALRDFYGEGPDAIDLYTLLSEVSLCTAIYGQAFPIQIFPRKGDNPEGAFDTGRSPAVLCLNPKTVWVGRVYSMSQWDYAIKPEDVEKWNDNLIEKSIPPMMYVALVMRDNEMLQMGKIPLNPEYIFPVRDKALSWERYAYPLLSRAIRSISTRQVLEEMIRATIEGYKNQLWVYKLGDKENPASPQKVKRLSEKLNALNNERTGQLIWTYDLTVEQHTPKPLDQLLANEAWTNLTFHMFTQIGINPYFISGIRQGRAASTGIEVDVDILVERVKSWHKQLKRLEYNIRRHWAEWSGVSDQVKEKIMKATVNMGTIDLNAAERIQKRIQPMCQMGYLSNQTALESAGYNYELELERKKGERKDAELFQPKATFSQTTVNPNTPESKTDNAPQGRPNEGVKNADQKAPQEVIKAAESGTFRL